MIMIAAGFEPATPCLKGTCATSCATLPSLAWLRNQANASRWSRTIIASASRLRSAVELRWLHGGYVRLSANGDGQIRTASRQDRSLVLSPIELRHPVWSVEDSNLCSPCGRPIYSRVHLPLCQRSRIDAPALSSKKRCILCSVRESNSRSALERGVACH